MATLTIEELREIEAAFEGARRDVHAAQAEFGTDIVFVPASEDDVVRALQLARAADRRVYVRSGASVAESDVVLAPLPPVPALAAVAGIAAAPPIPPKLAVALSMESFRGVDLRGDELVVQAGATTADVARELVGAGFFLGLADEPTPTVLASVLANRVAFPRSNSRTLRGAVSRARVIDVEGPQAGVPRDVAGQDLAALWTGAKPAVITELRLAGASAATEKERWFRGWVLDYERESFAALCDGLFLDSGLPDAVDLNVRVTSAAYGMRFVFVRCTGRTRLDRDLGAGVVESAIGAAGGRVIARPDADGPGDSLHAWVSSGPGASADHEVHVLFAARARNFVSFRDAILAATDFTIGAGEDGKDHAPRVRASVELELQTSGQVVSRAQLDLSDATPAVATDARARMLAAFPPGTRLQPSRARAMAHGIDVLPDLTPVTAFSLSTSSTGGQKIPGFLGTVASKATGDSAYRQAIQQYASTSYDAATVRARMEPSFVAQPVDAKDVVTAVEFAAARGWSVVARSGGHQYCGLSSGGTGTLLLDMARFTRCDVDATNAIATVGPGIRLRDLSAMLRKNAVTIPHGECPLVNIGGHVQTGGVGHQLRSLGLTLDWVSSFKMVCRTATGAYAEQTFMRPTTPPATPPSTGDVFRAVLGGGPGSWGVLTEITFAVARDEADAETGGYSRTYLYAKEPFRVAMEQMRKWMVRAADGKLPADRDLFVTVVSGDASPAILFRPPALLVETARTSAAAEVDLQAVNQAVDTQVSFGGAIASGLARLLGSEVSGPTPLSEIADAGVRKIGFFGLPKSGHEFDLPYKKSLYITRTPFTIAFRDRFVELVDRAHGTDGLKVVMQAVVGGGALAANAAEATTHMQRRDALMMLVFDVFHEPSKQAHAVAFQEEMRGLLGEYSGGEDIRMFWGTFEAANTSGAELDMSKPATQSLYYDPGAYPRLQEIKTHIDPTDVFHTTFTVKP